MACTPAVDRGVGGQVELAEDSAYVCLDGLGCEVQLLGDAAVGAAFGEEGQHVALACCQIGERVAGDGRGDQFRDQSGIDDRAPKQQAGRSEVRVLFVFDPWRAAILLVADDKTGNWDRWYREAIPRAERLYETYLAERQKEMGRRRSPSCATKRRAGGSPRCVNVEA